MEEVDVIIIGAGIVGLAIAEKLSHKYDNIILAEKEESFGRHTSSRNSEVIHSGIYYPKNSLKAKLCVRGVELLYDFVEKYNIPYNNCGKLIVATKRSELTILEELLKKGKNNGVKNLEIVSEKNAKELEPKSKSCGALWVPITGIMDTHKVMKKLEFLAEQNGVTIAYNTEINGIEKQNDDYIISLKDDVFKLKARILINSAGLWSDKISEMMGIDSEKQNYKLHFCKGEYYKTTKYKNIKHLVYPVPTDVSLGLHARINLDGELSFGPNAYYVDELNYQMDETYKKDFYKSINKYFYIGMADLILDDCGIRPKLQKEGGEFRDFVISNEKDKNLPNFVNLIGIDSPGLTCCLSIAEYVDKIIE